MGWNSLPPVIVYKLFDKRSPFYNLLTCLFLIEGKGRRGWREWDNERMVHGCVWDIVLYCINVLQYIRNSNVSQPPQGSTINVIRQGQREGTETSYTVSVMGQCQPILFFPRELKSNIKWKAPKLSHRVMTWLSVWSRSSLPSTPWGVLTSLGTLCLLGYGKIDTFQGSSAGSPVLLSHSCFPSGWLICLPGDVAGGEPVAKLPFSASPGREERANSTASGPTFLWDNSSSLCFKCN